MRIVQPSAALRGYISSIYVFDIDAPQPVDDLSVPEWGNIRLIHAGGYDAVTSGADPERFDYAMLQGPNCKAVRFRVQHCRMVGIGMLPAGFAQLWDMNVAAFAESAAPLTSLMGSRAAELIDLMVTASDVDQQIAIVDAHLTALIQSARLNPAIGDINRVQALLNDPAIFEAEQLAEAARMNPVALTRFCKRRFGFPPKLLLRRQRFLRMLEAMHGRPYAEWPDFLDPHYTDQSHMIRDFRYFMGMSPTHYLALPRMVQQASAMHRSQVLGTVLQGLT
jgi:methylphosphotriester-DNA--protein-cysteine methyltransferase